MNDKDYPIKYKTMYFQLKVKDIERAKKFYEDIFGFQVSWYQSPDVGWCEFNLPGGSPCLGLNVVAEGEEIAPSSGILTISVENIESTKTYLENKGIETTEIVDIPNLVSYFNMKDSEGNAIQIVADPRVNE
ncbi:MAG: VOC family protein [Candidatus Heimdallarchaeaceae archaeon]